MARIPKVWLRAQTGWYCTTLNGETIKLSKDKKEAEKAFHTLLAHWPAPHFLVQPLWESLMLLFSQGHHRLDQFNRHVPLVVRRVSGRGFVA